MSNQKQKISGLLGQMESKRPKRQGQDEESLSFQATHRAPENLLNAHINVRTTKEYRDEVKLYSVHAGMSLQDLVAKALDEYMERNPVDR